MSKKHSSVDISDYIDLPNGGKLHLLPVSQNAIEKISKEIAESFEEKGKVVTPPAYTTSAGETIAWTKESVDKDGTNEEKNQWQQYEADRQELVGAQEQATSEHILLYGTHAYETANGDRIDLTVNDITGEWSPPAGWLRMKERVGYSLPDDGYQAKLDYLNYVISDVLTIRDVVTRCIILSMKGVVPEDLLHEAEDNFRSAMARAAEGKIGEARNALKNLDETIGDQAEE